LAQYYFKGYDYVNLEDPEIRAYATEDPKGFLPDHPAPLIIDEIQRVPQSPFREAVKSPLFVPVLRNIFHDLCDGYSIWSCSVCRTACPAASVCWF
jgi:hypothetical protein